MKTFTEHSVDSVGRSDRAIRNNSISSGIYSSEYSLHKINKLEYFVTSGHNQGNIHSKVHADFKHDKLKIK